MVYFINDVVLTLPDDHIGGIMKFKVKLEPCEEGGYTIWVPALPGCISEGETIEECMKNIREAIELYLESIDDDDKPQEGILIKELSFD